MDIPEIRIVRRVLKKEWLDPAVALAVLLRTMMADHVDTLLELGDAAFRSARGLQRARAAHAARHDLPSVA